MFNSHMFILLFLFIWSCRVQKHAMRSGSGSSQSFLSVVSEATRQDVAHQAILEKRLASHLKASVGIVLCYSSDKQGKCILLGREQPGKCGGGTWCELGGRVEPGEKFLEAAIREAEEESGGMYRLKSNDILNNGVVYYNENKKGDGTLREEVFIFVKTEDYHTADALIMAVNQQVKAVYKEKDDFKWITLSSLLAAKQNPCFLQDIEGHRVALTLRPFFYEALQREAFRTKLAFIG